MKPRFIALLALAACAGEEASPPSPAPDAPPASVGFTVADSAGVEIVRNSEPRFGDASPIALGDRPALRIGSIDGRDALGEPVDAVRLTDGRVLILDSQTQEVLVFDAEGGPVATWGGEGGGPGEFVRARTLDRLPGDTVVVIDRRQLRTTVFDPSGELVRTFRHDFDYVVPRGFMPSQSCCVPVVAIDGESVLWRYPDQWNREGTGDRPVTTMVIVTGEATTDTLGEFPAGVAGFWPNGMNPVVREEFTWSAHFAVRAGRVVAGRGDRLGWDEFDPTSGAILRSVRADLARQPITPSDVERSRPQSREASPETTGRLASRPVADSFPAFDHMVVGSDGSAWLWEPTSDPSAPSAYQWFSPAGEWMGRVEFPTMFWALDAGEGWVLGATRGEFDEAYVELWTFTAPGR